MIDMTEFGKKKLTDTIRKQFPIVSIKVELV